jgi:hypothetical protein
MKPMDLEYCKEPFRLVGYHRFTAIVAHVRLKQRGDIFFGKTRNDLREAWLFG